MIGEKCCARLPDLEDTDKSATSVSVCTCDTCRAAAAGHCRTPPGDGDVLGPRRLDGALRPHGPGGPARDHFGLSEGVAETVRRFGGFVAKYMGDGVLVYFGYPQAHEDDAERAVRAGLELIAAVPRSRPRRAPADARRHCDRAGGRRRPDRIGRGSGARHRRRDAKPRGAPARRSPSRTWS